MSHTPLDEARALLDADDPGGAYRLLRPLLSYPAELGSDAATRERLRMLARVTGRFGGPDAAATIEAAATSPDDPLLLYESAHMLYEQHQYGIAASLLVRANHLAPGQPTIVTELCAAFEAMGANALAAEAIEQSGLADRDAMCAYLLAFNYLMAGDVTSARANVPDAARMTGGTLRFVLAALEGMRARADVLQPAVSLEGNALTAWHAALNGSVLLHESPHGYEEPMHGRYAMLGDSPGLMREGIEAVRRALNDATRTPRSVVSAPDRASRILGLATARHLGLPLQPYDPNAAATALHHALIVVWDLDHVGDAGFLGAFRDHAPGQVLWTHASSWTNPFPYSPDLTTLLYQSITHPYLGGGMRVDPETRSVTTAPPDARSEEALAEEILTAEIHDSTAAPGAAERIIRASRDLPATRSLGVFRDEGPRTPQRMGSVVPSARFT